MPNRYRWVGCLKLEFAPPGVNAPGVEIDARVESVLTDGVSHDGPRNNGAAPDPASWLAGYRRA